MLNGIFEDMAVQEFRRIGMGEILDDLVRQFRTGTPLETLKERLIFGGLIAANRFGIAKKRDEVKAVLMEISEALDARTAKPILSLENVSDLKVTN